MKSQTTRHFWRCYARLPVDTQNRAKKAYALWHADPAHPGLNFKRVSRTRPVYSVRISLAFRALSLLQNETITWFWIGSHDDYEKLLNG